MLDAFSQLLPSPASGRGAGGEGGLPTNCEVILGQPPSSNNNEKGWQCNCHPSVGVFAAGYFFSSGFFSFSAGFFSFSAGFFSSAAFLSAAALASSATFLSAAV